MEKLSQDISSILHSQYVIDGVSLDVPPIALIDEDAAVEADVPDVVDESVEPALGSVCYDRGKIHEYMDAVCMVKGAERQFNMPSRSLCPD